MGKAPNNFAIVDHPSRPYMVGLRFHFDKRLQYILSHEVPGTVYDPSIAPGAWAAPRECIEKVASLAKAAGYAVKDQRGRLQVSKAIEIKDTKAYPYQKAGAVRILSHKRYMLAYEMGIGKTFTTILAMRHAQVKTALIICPAIVRQQWADEIAQWWPGAPEIGVIDSSKAATKLADKPFQSVSYELCHKVVRGQHDFIVIDESHYIASEKARRSKAVRAIVDANPGAYIVLLTGTPITNEPVGLRFQLDTLYPGRVGSYWNFVHQYCLVEETDYTDFWVHGVNPETVGELRRRLEHMAHRITKHEVAHLMPPFVVSPIRVKPNRQFNAAEMLADFSRMDRHNGKRDALIRSCGSEKVQASVEFALEAAKVDNKKIAILTYLKATAKDIEASCRKAFKHKVGLWRFDGDDSQKKRATLISTALKHKGPGVLICTMSSVKEGINSMAGFDGALLAELYSTPGLMAQVLGRFHRLSNSCNVWVLYVEGTQEEMIAVRLQKKMDTAGQLLAKSTAEESLGAALEGDEEEEFESLQAMALERIEEDCYA